MNTNSEENSIGEDPPGFLKQKAKGGTGESTKIEAGRQKENAERRKGKRSGLR